MALHDRDLDRMKFRAGHAVERTVRAGAINYRRDIHLPRLLRLFPAEIPSAEPEATRLVLARLIVEARRERRRARSSHWTYDLNRHIALMQAVSADGSTWRPWRVGQSIPDPIRHEARQPRRRRCPRPIFLARAERAAA